MRVTENFDNLEPWWERRRASMIYVIAITYKIIKHWIKALMKVCSSKGENRAFTLPYSFFREPADPCACHRAAKDVSRLPGLLWPIGHIRRPFINLSPICGGHRHAGSPHANSQPGILQIFLQFLRSIKTHVVMKCNSVPVDDRLTCCHFSKC